MTQLVPLSGEAECSDDNIVMDRVRLVVGLGFELVESVQGFSPVGTQLGQGDGLLLRSEVRRGRLWGGDRRGGFGERKRMGNEGKRGENGGFVRERGREGGFGVKDEQFGASQSHAFYPLTSVFLSFFSLSLPPIVGFFFSDQI